MNVYESVLEKMLGVEDTKYEYVLFDDRQKAVQLAWAVENNGLGEAVVGAFGERYLTAMSVPFRRKTSMRQLPEYQAGEVYEDLEAALRIDVAVGFVMAERASMTQEVSVRYMNKLECRTRVGITSEYDGTHYTIRSWIDDPSAVNGSVELIELKEVASIQQEHRVNQLTGRLRKAVLSVSRSRLSEKDSLDRVITRLRESLQKAMDSTNIGMIDSEMTE